MLERVKYVAMQGKARPRGADSLRLLVGQRQRGDLVVHGFTTGTERAARARASCAGSLRPCARGMAMIAASSSARDQRRSRGPNTMGRGIQSSSRKSWNLRTLTPITAAA
jgi:hypothetical protein